MKYIGRGRIGCKRSKRLTECGSEIILNNSQPKFHAVTEDSVAIHVDNCSSRSSSFRKEDFKELRPCRYNVMGYSSKTMIEWCGTVEWMLPDDQGQVHAIQIPNTLFAPDSNARTLSPQHWGQDNRKKNKGTVMVSHDDETMVVQWENNKKTLKINNSNVFVWETAPSSRFKVRLNNHNN